MGPTALHVQRRNPGHSFERRGFVVLPGVEPVGMYQASTTMAETTGWRLK